MASRSLTLGGLAAKMLVHRIRKSDASRKRLVDALGLAHGLPQKIGQILATTDIESGAADFLPLTEGKPTLSAKEAFDAMDREWARNGLPFRVATCFSEIDPHGISASLGQVHRARLRDGRLVAVKLQYPDVSDHVARDLKALGWLTRPVGHLGRGFDEKAYRCEIGTRLKAELDYRQEAANLREFQKVAKNCPHLLVPEVIAECSTDRLLVCTWLEGSSFSTTASWSREERTHLSRTLLDGFLGGIFDWGLLHADPHPGNYRFIRAAGALPQVGLIDFGSVHRVPSTFARALRLGIVSVRKGIVSPEEARGFFEALGFDLQALRPLDTLLPSLQQTLLEPFCHPGPWNAAAWNLPQRLTPLLGPHRMTFRLAGPPDLLFFIRAFQGLVRYLSALDAPLSWSDAFDRIDASAVVRFPSECQDPAPANQAVEALFSAHLRLRMTDGGDVKVDLTLPSNALHSLPSFIPPHLLPRIAEQGLSLESIVSKALESRGKPGQLLSFAEGSKTIILWLE